MCPLIGHGETGKDVDAGSSGSPEAEDNIVDTTAQIRDWSVPLWMIQVIALQMGSR